MLQATNNLAPVLLYYQPYVVQEWGMAIMKYLGTIDTLYDMIRNSSLKLNTDERILIYQNIINAIQLFHDNNYVFGDLRENNIIITHLSNIE